MPHVVRPVGGGGGVEDDGEAVVLALVEHVGAGEHALATTGDFVLPNVYVLTVRHGEIVHLRDYVNVLAAAAAMGRSL